MADYATALVNVQSGGGGPTASDAILLVTVPAGSVVTMTKGADTRVPTMWVSAADPTLETALFVVEAADFDSTAWTVTATLGVKTASGTVVINSNAQYSLILNYRKYVIKDGYIQADFTLTYNLRSGQPVHFTENYNSLSCARVYTNGAYAGGFVTQQIDVTSYIKLVLDAQSENTYGNIFLGVYNAASYSTLDAIHAGALAEQQKSPNITRFQSELNIAAISQNGFVGICIATANYSNVPLRVFNLWLE